MPKNVIIMGMARSGTSLTTSIFANHGYFVDEEEAIAPRNHMNPTGYWESTSLLKLNEDILRSSGFEFDNTWIYRPITPEQVDTVDRFEAGDEHRELLARFENSAPWVWKDPRLCYTLGSWWPILDHSNTVVLLIRRNPEAIYNSFVRVGWRKPSAASREATFERIKNHIENAERIIKKYQIPVITFEYEDFKKRPEMIVKMINQACNLELTVDDLGYNDKFNHNSVSGVFSTLIDRFVSKLPKKWIKVIKHLVPRSLLTRLYPERYEK